MSGLPSDHVRSRSTLWECCELMDWTANRFKPYTYNAIVMSKLLYASPAWYGFTSKEDRDRIDSFMRKLIIKIRIRSPRPKPHSPRCVENLMTKCSKKSVWMSIMCCIACCRLYVNVTGHNLRRRTHSFVLPAKCKTVLQDNNFFKRVLYKDSY